MSMQLGCGVSSSAVTVAISLTRRDACAGSAQAYKKVPLASSVTDKFVSSIRSHAADLLLELYTVQITSRNVNVIQTTWKLIRGEMENNASMAINH